MRQAKPILSLLSALLLLSCGSALAFDRSHALFTAELRKYVDGGDVHYRLWQKDQDGLNKYLKSLADLTPADYQSLTPSDREALWLNVFDALTVKIVLDHYPMSGKIPWYPPTSMRQIPNVWEGFPIVVGGRKLNLYQIEHDILRREVKDVRTHFTISCAAKGYGPMPTFAYTSKNLEQQLNLATRRFLFDKKNLEIDKEKQVVYVSQIFKWFPLDFLSQAGFDKIPFPPPPDDEVILGYLALHGTGEARHLLRNSSTRSQYKVVYRPFDWSLNDADAPAPSKEAK
jgi:hypothetical protein